MEEPQSGGAMHLIAIACVVVLTVFLCVFFHNADKNTFRAILISVWAIMFVMEVLKQVSLSCTFDEEGKMNWHYHWSIFTLQLCDSPLYMLLPIAFLKDGKLRSGLSVYMATYVLLGGIATYGFPASIFSPNLYCNVHSLVHHGLQIASCALIGVHNRKSLRLRYFAMAIGVFLAFIAVATLYNVGMHFWHPEEHVNMLFISPYEVKRVPDIVYGAWKAMGWGGRMVLYIFGVTGLAFIAYWLNKLFFQHVREKRVTA